MISKESIKSLEKAGFTCKVIGEELHVGSKEDWDIYNKFGYGTIIFASDAEVVRYFTDLLGDSLRGK